MPRARSRWTRRWSWVALHRRRFLTPDRADGGPLCGVYSCPRTSRRCPIASAGAAAWSPGPRGLWRGRPGTWPPCPAADRRRDRHARMHGRRDVLGRRSRRFIGAWTRSTTSTSTRRPALLPAPRHPAIGPASRRPRPTSEASGRDVDTRGICGCPFHHHGRGERRCRRGRGGRRPARVDHGRLRAGRRGAAHLPPDVAEAQAIKATDPAVLAMGEARPLAGRVRPVELAGCDVGLVLRDRVVVQRTSAGTQGFVAARRDAPVVRQPGGRLRDCRRGPGSALGARVYLLTGRDPAGGPESGSDDRATASSSSAPAGPAAGSGAERPRSRRPRRLGHARARPVSAPPEHIAFAIRVDAFSFAMEGSGRGRIRLERREPGR